MPLHMTTIAITPDPKLAELRDAEVEFVSTAMSEGTITSLHVANDRTRLWMTTELPDGAAVHAFVRQFPYAPWFAIESVDEVFSA